jgi:hypothetical protein
MHLKVTKNLRSFVNFNPDFKSYTKGLSELGFNDNLK